MVVGKDFLEQLFSSLWNTLHVPDTGSSFEVRDAVETLRKSARLEWSELAVCLGVLPNTLHSMQVSGKYKPEVLKRLAKLSLEYGMPLLSEWFNHRAVKLFMNKGKKQADRWGATRGI
jgi:hypothetical protein